MNKNHNKTSIEAYYDEDGRVKISPEVMKLLKPKLIDDKYFPHTIKDRHLLGFRAIAHKGGQRSFFYRYRPKGKKENNKPLDHLTIYLGRYFDPSDPKEKNKIGYTPAVARKMAQDMQMKIKSGEDPYSILEARKKGKSLRMVFTDWIEKRLKSVQYKKSVDDYRSRYNVYILQNSKQQKHKQMYRSFRDAFKIVHAPIKTLQRDDYIALHSAVSQYFPFQANRLMEDIRLVEKYAIENKVMTRAAISFPKKSLNKELKRLEQEDPFTPQEIFRFRAAALSLIRKDRERYLVPCMQLLLAANLGLRSKSEVYSLMWDVVNVRDRKMNILDTKNKKPFKKEYDYKAAAILRIMLQHRRSINHRDKRFAYVFPTPYKKSKNKFCKDPRKTYQSILKLAKLPYKGPHFLRHTWATNNYAATGDIKGIAASNNWSDLKSLEIYTQVSDRVKRKILKTTNSYLNKHRSHAS